MTLTMGLVACLLPATLGLLALNRWPPAMVMMGAAALLLLCGVLSPEEVLTGFATPGLATIVVLYVVVAGLQQTGAISLISRLLLGRPQSMNMALLRLMLPTSMISALVNNTPVVAMMIPAVREWGRRHGYRASRLLIPLSYASILGGTCSLIGTSTNLVVDGFMRQQGLGSFTLFELAWVGVPLVLAGVVFVLLVGQYLLPERAGSRQQFEQVREYLVELQVAAGCPLIGDSIEQAGLRNLPGLFLVEIGRAGRVLQAVSPELVLAEGDRLVFTGAVDSVAELRQIRGLQMADDQLFKLGGSHAERRLFEAVVSAGNPMVGQTLRQARFRHRYGAVVLAVSRHGRRLNGKLGQAVIQPGDTLLLEGLKGFLFKYQQHRDFLLVTRIDCETISPDHARAPLALGLLALGIALTVSGVMDLLSAAVLCAAAMLLCGCVSPDTARRSVDMSLVLVIGCAFALGAAVQKVGLAAMVADQAVALAGNSPWLTLALIYLATVLLTELITNNAAALVMFPVALSASHSLGVSFEPFAVALMIAASAAFISPIGYQTNLMVMGPGGYRFADYIRIGLPLSLLTGVTAVGLIPVIWPF